MSRIWTCGFEANDGTVEGLSPTGLSLSTAAVRTGAFSYSCTDNTETFSFSGGALARDYYVRVYFYPTSTPAVGSKKQVIGDGKVDVWYLSDGTLQMFDGALSAIGTASVALALNTWYRVELHFKYNSGSADDTAELVLNGTQVYITTTATLSTTAPASLRFDTFNGSAGVGAALDDIAFNDSQGSSQTSFPGEGNVVLLVPTADSAKGTGWTNDAAGASNFFAAVANEPPAGIADTTAGSGLHQIRNATANANSSYDATMTTYSAAGIAAVDTVNVIDPIVATGAPVTTSSKQGTVGVVSNPAITNVALGAGGTSGAFWSGNAAGTYPTGWKISHGTVTYGSSVTVGTAPVMRITQVTSSTRIAMVCFMGIYVDYTPGHSVYVNPMPPMIAQ